MKSLSRMIAIATVSLLSTLSFTPAAQACKCMMPSPTDARDNASAVFEGHVQNIEKVGGDGAMGRHVVTLSIVRTWKGLENEETVKVNTASETAACGIFFEVGKSFLVYAQDGENGLEAGSCGRTREVSAAEEDLAALGAGVTPVKVEPTKAEPAVSQTPAEPAKPPATRSSSCGYSSASKSAASSLFFAAPAVGLVLARRRRKG